MRRVQVEKEALRRTAFLDQQRLDLMNPTGVFTPNAMGFSAELSALNATSDIPTRRNYGPSPGRTFGPSPAGIERSSSYILLLLHVVSQSLFP